MSKFFEAASKLDPSLVVSVLTEPAARRTEVRPAESPASSLAATSRAVSAVLVEPAAPAPAPAPVMPAARPAAAKTEAIQCAGEFSLSDRTSKAVLPFDGTSEEVSERYRILRTKILQHPHKPQLVCVTSPTTGDGKSVTALNIAGVLGLKENTRVLLIDCDFRHPSVVSMIRLPAAGGGVAEVLTGKIAWHQAILRCKELPNFYIAPAGQAQGRSAELLDSKAWRNSCDELRKQFDFIVIDTPPIGLVADYDLIQASCDGVVMVARPNHTDRTSLNKALLAVPPEKSLGVVVNCVERWFLWKAQDYTYAYRDRNNGVTSHEHR
jgi:capsular exopolysaccharide synthesis family protein